MIDKMIDKVIDKLLAAPTYVTSFTDFWQAP